MTKKLIILAITIWKLSKQKVNIASFIIFISYLVFYVTNNSHASHITIIGIIDNRQKYRPTEIIICNEARIPYTYIYIIRHLQFVNEISIEYLSSAS